MKKEIKILITDASTSEVTLATLPCNEGEDVSEVVSLYFTQINVKESEADWMEVPSDWTSKDINTGPPMLDEQNVIEKLPFICKECGCKELVKEVVTTNTVKYNITNIIRHLEEDYPQYDQKSKDRDNERDTVYFRCDNCNIIIASEEIGLVQVLKEHHCPPKLLKQRKKMELPVKVFHCSECMDDYNSTEGCFTIDVSEHMHKAESPCLDGTWGNHATKPDFKEITSIPTYILQQVMHDLGTHEASGNYIKEYINSLRLAIQKDALEISSIPSVGVFNNVKDYLNRSRFHFHLGADDFFTELNKKCHEFRGIELQESKLMKEHKKKVVDVLMNACKKNAGFKTATDHQKWMDKGFEDKLRPVSKETFDMLIVEAREREGDTDEPLDGDDVDTFIAELKSAMNYHEGNH